jgi:hypothetical protein
MRIGALQVFFSINSTCWCFVRYRNSDRQSGRKRAKLLETLYHLERMGRKRYPLLERFARVRIHSNMLQCTLGEPPGIGAIA